MGKSSIEKIVYFLNNIDTCNDVCESQKMSCLNYNNCTECIIDYLKENINLIEM